MAITGQYCKIDIRYFNMIRPLLALLILASPILGHTLNKVMVEDPDAFCLDGTKPAYYVHEGDPNKFILSFEGGGWCGSAQYSREATLENCFQRSKGALGSSTPYPATISFSQGILSDNQHNPYRTWTIVHMKYCDGTGHQGYKKDPVEYKGSKLWFRGHNATTGQLNSINEKFKLFSSATDIIVTGQSAGGLATFLWSNYITDRAPKQAKVWSVPDSGIFLDSGNYITQQHNYRTLFLNLMAIVNVEVSPPTKECVDANHNQKWKCLFAEYIHPFIKIPLFPINSLYDSWSLPNILGLTCGSAPSLANCNQGQMEVINQYKKNTTDVMNAIGKNPKNGGWGPACSDHVYSAGGAFYSTSFEVPEHTNNMLATCLSNWVKGSDSNHLHIDSVSWPENRPCSGVNLATE